MQFISILFSDNWRLKSTMSKFVIAKNFKVLHSFKINILNQLPYSMKKYLILSIQSNKIALQL